jgi:hypothetical protein
MSGVSAWMHLLRHQLRAWCKRTAAEYAPAWRRYGRPVRWVIKHPARWAVTVAAAAIIGPAAWLGVTHLLAGDEPSVQEGLERIRHLAATSGRQVMIKRPVDLHGSGRESYVIVTVPVDEPHSDESDEVSIYDVRDGGLRPERPEFSFRPRQDESGNPYKFDLREVIDPIGNGQLTIIGVYTRFLRYGDVSYPVYIRWDPRSEEYEFGALLPADQRSPGQGFPLSARPRLRENRGYYHSPARSLFVRPITLIDVDGVRRIRSYGASSFLLNPDAFESRGMRIIAVWFYVGDRGPYYFYEIQNFWLNFTTTPAIADRCPETDRADLIRGGIYEDKLQAVIERWRKQLRKQGECFFSD